MTARNCAAPTSCIAKGRKKIREAAPYAVRFHLAPGVEATRDRRRHGRDPALARRAAVEFPLPRRQCSTIEESLWIDGRGRPQPHHAAGRSSAKSRAFGGEIGWQFRRTS